MWRCVVVRRTRTGDAVVKEWVCEVVVKMVEVVRVWGCEVGRSEE